MSEAPRRPFRPVLLIDLDDTLFDHTGTSRDALVRLRDETPWMRALSVEQIQRRYSELLEAAHEQVVRGLVSVDEARLERFRGIGELVGHSVDRAEGAGLVERYQGLYRERRRAIPGATALLRHLHGRVPVAIVTNNRTAEQEEKLAVLGLADYVDALIISESVGVSKPDPAIFRIALEAVDAAPREAVMVGDSWASDVLGARASGIRAVWFNRFRAPRPPGDRSISVAELTSLEPATAVEAMLPRPE